MRGGLLIPNAITAAPAVPAASATGAAPQPRLVRAAHEFEAQMMKELMAPLNHADALTGDGDGDDAGSNGALGDFASEALGRALSDRGGFGVATKIVEQLSHSGNLKARVPSPGNPHRDTVIKAHE
jgi:flagellar protein FlgJ